MHNVTFDLGPAGKGGISRSSLNPDPVEDGFVAETMRFPDSQYSRG